MRIDKYLVERGLVETRSKAVYLIKTGEVLVNGKVVLKQAFNVDNHDKVELKSKYRYVGRGGYKIEGFFKKIKLNCKGKKILDIGCSVGGFSDFFLQNGASKVYSIDIAKEIIHKKLLNDPRLKFFGGIDVRNKKMLEACLNHEKFDVIAIDVSNIPLEEILCNVSSFLEREGFIIALFKPPYEGESGRASEEKIEILTERFEEWLNKSYEIIDKEFSHIRGGSKNRGSKEVFYLLKNKN